VTGVAGLVLAAGEGRRFGGPKALVRLDGELLVERAARVLREGGCDPVLVVLGAAADDVRAGAHLSGGEVVVAAGWREGMGASLRAGLAALEPRPAQAVVVALADQPRVGAEAVRRLRAAWAGSARAAVATYSGQPRNPVLLDRSTWAGVAAAAVGDVGARGWLAAHPGDVVTVACDDTGSPADVDTAEDLAALAAPTDPPPPHRPVEEPA
jgi:CTP:molybdopterin cytidylyltransferase MocA